MNKIITTLEYVAYSAALIMALVVVGVLMKGGFF